ncbi:hypothetical protein [Pseudoduganella buxea]|nr:hypothetical protein [Pseudoduganella buxea]MTV54099.1 hypothetical protein [Pseudoduganella buxea]
MMLHQKIPTTSARLHPLMAGAAVAVILFSVVATVAIVRWLPAAGRSADAGVDAGVDASVDVAVDTGIAAGLPAGYVTVSSPVPATAARASSATAAAAETQAAPSKAKPPRQQPQALLAQQSAV